MWSKIKINWVFTTVVALFVATLVVAAPIYASTVTSPSDSLSTEEAGVAANHNLFFTTSSGVTESKIITLTFASDFNTASLTEDDIDLTDDGIDLTTAANCSGTEKASVSIASDIVTITICAGDGGAIVAGSIVGVEIGTNATSSGTGVNQITNPATVGTYFVTIGGDFGDTGSIAIPIITDGSVGVTGTVEGDGGGGGSPGPTPPKDCTDVINPTISNVLVSSITTNSAIISWTTDEAASGTLRYGLTDSFELGTLINSNFLSAQSITLTGLTSGGIYYYQIVAEDTCRNQTSSSTNSFVTVDVVAPIISNIQVLEISETTARITWDTNEVASSRIDYGTTAGYGLSLSDETLVTSHSLILASLEEGTAYHFKITATDGSQNTAVSTDQTFTTARDLPPANVSQFTATPRDARVVLSWINPTDNDFAAVVILFCTSRFPLSSTDTGCQEIYRGNGLSFIHIRLTNNQTYYYGAFAFDENLNFASGALASATPLRVDVCGDGICGQTESSFVCLNDCPIPVEPEPTEEPTEEETPDEQTGDQETDGSETDEETTDSETGNGENLCGNGICDSGETNNSCQSDCSSIEIPPTNISEEEAIPSTDVSFLLDRTIAVTVREGIFDALTSSDLSVIVSAENISKEVEQAYLTIGSETYLLALENGAYHADVTTSGTSTRHALHVVIEYTDSTAQNLSFIVNLLNSGLIFEKSQEQTTPVSGVSVTLLVSENGDWVVWDGSPWQQFNPVTTNENGTFAWYAENGNYKIVTQKKGYEDTNSGAISVTNNIIGPRIEIKKIEEVTLQSAVVDVVNNVTETIQETVQTLRESPTAQTAAQVATPVIVATSVASVAVMATSLNLLPFLRFLFTSPLLLFSRRKRKAFGVVYHAFTKTPIDLATIRLYRVSDNKLVISRVTDKGGRYFFMVQPGTYRVEVVKQGFVFPSQSLMNVKDDAIYLDVYHGEQITVSEKNTVITPNIPVEPLDNKQTKTPWQIKKTQLFRRLQKFVAATSVFISLYVLIIYFNIWSLALFALQIGVYLLTLRLATTPKPKSWGIVYDKITNRPLSNVIVRLFEPKYHKLLETWMTDSKGRYAFILGPNEYSSTYEKNGYQPAEIHPIDLSQNKEVTHWAQDIKLEPKISDPTIQSKL